MTDDRSLDCTSIERQVYMLPQQILILKSQYYNINNKIMTKIISKLLVLVLLNFSFQVVKAQEKEAFKKTFKMEGRIMYDFEFLNAGDSLNFAGNEFRRVRWATKGFIAKNVGYKVEFDFAGGKVNFRDIFLNFKLPSYFGAVKVGSFTEPSSLNNMTSSKYITFFERSMMSNTQPFKYNAGFMYDNQKILDGKIGFQMSYTFNGDKAKAFQDRDLYGGANFVSRLTTNFLKNKEKHQVVHLGVNYEYRKNNADDYHYKFRTENHLGDEHIVSGEGNFKNTSDVGFEFAANQGSFSLQTEYEISSIVTDIDTYKAAGYYAFASFFITGEHRPYKKSSFGRVKPKKDFCIKDGGFGAVELVARYSVMDFSSYPGVKTNDKIKNITAGFNWYLNNYARIMYNYTLGDYNDFKTYGNFNLTGHLIRLQLDF